MDLLKIRPVNLYRLTKITETTENTIEFCKDVGLLPKSVECPTCSVFCMLKIGNQHKFVINVIKDNVMVVEKNTVESQKLVFKK